MGNAIGGAAKAVGNTVKTAVVNTVKAIKEDPLKFVTGVVVGAAAAIAVGAVCATGVGCLLLAGAVAGAAAAGAEYGTDVARGRKEFSVGELGKEMAVGAVVGVATAGVGVIGGKVLSKARQSMRKGGDKVADDAAANAPPAKRKDPCAGSFAPATPVLLADGSTKPIGEVVPGDAVVATNPQSGVTTAETVEKVHDNADFDLTDLEVLVNGQAEDIETTWTHPFWDATDGRWVFAAQLVAGHELQSADGSPIIVRAVHNHVGNESMRDLTVANVHTYYVVTAEVPFSCTTAADEVDVYHYTDKKGYNAITSGSPHVIKASDAWIDAKRLKIKAAWFSPFKTQGDLELEGDPWCDQGEARVPDRVQDVEIDVQAIARWSWKPRLVHAPRSRRTADKRDVQRTYEELPGWTDDHRVRHGLPCRRAGGLGDPRPPRRGGGPLAGDARPDRGR